MKIKGFCHVLGTAQGQRIVLEQLDRIKRSGLWDRTERIYIGSVGGEITLPADEKIEHFHNPDAEQFERWTLSRLHRECQGDDCLAWYIHSKGASWTADDPRWRYHMEREVIDGHARCVDALKVARTCGPLGMTNPEPYYAGNFWWARADYVRGLMTPDDWARNTVDRGGTCRHSCETWIAQANYHLHLFLSYAQPLLSRWQKQEQPVEWMYKSYADITRDAHDWCDRLPAIGAVCGLPKSGVIIAALIAQRRNIPLVSIDALLLGETSYRRAGRNQRQVEGPTLIVDDTSSSGETIRHHRERLNRKDVLFGALYARSNAQVELAGFPLVSGYHTFEYNFMRDGLTVDYVCDLDGVFRQDWTGGGTEESDPSRYEEFLRYGRPTHLLPTYGVLAIVSASLGKYRHLTEAWLSDHGITYGELVLPFYSLADRAGQDVAAVKAREYQRFRDATLFVESEAGQAGAIRQATGRPVFCTDTMTFLN